MPDNTDPGDFDNSNIGKTGSNMNDYPVGSAASTDILSSTFLLGNVGAPFVIGLAVGYFAKKMLRMALFLGGAAIVLLFITEYYGVTSMADAKLQGAADAASHMARQSGSFLMERLSHITSKGVSAVAGFFVGLKMG
ncbi:MULTISPECIES: FUN14 domain-containing protein [unclassified Thiothrix]|nr:MULTISPECIES: FUN14 domain-containing protein [unclassified Thiothrix]